MQNRRDTFRSYLWWKNPPNGDSLAHFNKIVSCVARCGPEINYDYEWKNPPYNYRGP